MTFGDALKAVKNGRLITRDGWNGKGMFVYYQPGTKIEIEDLRCEAIKSFAFKNFGHTIKIHGHLDMKNAKDEIIVGWLASQVDMIAEDWRVLE